MAFNQEPVARAIAGCPVPVVTAVGHEVDFTIADFVADVRAPTPSAAAEMVIAAKEEFSARIDRQSRRLRAAVAAGLDRRRTRLHALSSRRGLAGFPARLAMRGRHTAELTHQLRGVIVNTLTRREREFRALAVRLEARDLAPAVRRDPRQARRRDRTLARRHRPPSRPRRRAPGHGCRPSRVHESARGARTGLCGVLERRSHRAFSGRAADVAAGDRVHVTLHDGELSCVVEASKDTNHGPNDQRL